LKIHVDEEVAYARPMPDRETPRRLRAGFWVATFALTLAHLLRFQHGDEALYLGWLPADLAFRIVWIAAATVVIFVMTSVSWRGDQGESP
jgi:hypothetical protein